MEERLTNRVYETKVQGRNKKGRPRKTWNEGLKGRGEKETKLNSKHLTVERHRI